jgi:tetratricopeptide (TPR) repeat protein
MYLLLLTFLICSATITAQNCSPDVDYLARVRSALSQNNSQQAMLAYDCLISQNPDVPDYYIERAWFHLDSGNIEAALADNQTALSLGISEQERIDLLIQQFTIFQYELQYEEALATIDRILSLPDETRQHITPDRWFNIYTGQAMIYLQSGNFEQAQMALNNAQQQDVSPGYALFLAGVLQEKQDNILQAREYYQAALDEFPELPGRVLRHGSLYLFAEHYDSAIEYTSYAIMLMNISPGSSELDYVYYIQRGLAYRDSGNYAEAVNDFTRALALKPDEPPLLFMRGCALVELDRHMPAIRDLDRYVVSEPTIDSKAYLCRGDAWYALNHNELAYADYLYYRILVGDDNIPAYVEERIKQLNSRID